MLKITVLFVICIICAVVSGTCPPDGSRMSLIYQYCTPDRKNEFESCVTDVDCTYLGSTYCCYKSPNCGRICAYYVPG